MSNIGNIFFENLKFCSKLIQLINIDLLLLFRFEIINENKLFKFYTNYHLYTDFNQNKFLNINLEK